MPPPKPPAGRSKVAASATAVLKAGSLGHELRGHAFERATHFFYFVVTMKMVVTELNRLLPAGSAPYRFSRWVSKKATEQIGAGLRSDHAAYAEFDTADAAIVDAQTTRFTRVDAAHFCNLGLKQDFAAVCQASPFTRDGYERLKVYAGNTMWLPQQVNIGPDRIVDELHGTLAQAMLDDDAVIFSLERVREYVTQLGAGLRRYADGKHDQGELGLEACARCYLAAYADPKGFEDRVYRQVYPEIIGLCEASPALKGQAHRFFT